MEVKPRVLLVDDESAITANLAPFLERAGFTVAVAADGEEALSQIASFAPNLIILMGLVLSLTLTRSKAGKGPSSPVRPGRR